MNQSTANLNLKLIKYNQAQKEIIANEAFITLDAFSNPSVEDITDDISVAQKDGRKYIYNSRLCFYQNGWRYIDPKEGWIFWIYKRKNYYYFDGKVWNLVKNEYITCSS